MEISSEFSTPQTLRSGLDIYIFPVVTVSIGFLTSSPNTAVMATSLAFLLFVW